MNAKPYDIGPVKLCCGQKHYGLICPDGKVMCCICFERVQQHQLNVINHNKGTRENVCVRCAAEEKMNEPMGA